MTLLCSVVSCRIPGRHNDGCDAEDCRGCLPARAADGLMICQHHTDRLGPDAEEAAELHVELALVLAGQSGPGDGIAQKNPGQGIALKPRVVEHRTLIKHTLVSWTLLVAEERGISLPRDSTASLGAFLARHALWLAAQEFAGEVSDELSNLVQTGRSLRQPSDTKVVEIGPCPRTVEADNVVNLCGGTLRALLRKEASLLPSAVQCDANDDHCWSSSEWRHLGREMRTKA